MRKIVVLGILFLFVIVGCTNNLEENLPENFQELYKEYLVSIKTLDGKWEMQALDYEGEMIFDPKEGSQVSGLELFYTELSYSGAASDINYFIEFDDNTLKAQANGTYTVSKNSVDNGQSSQTEYTYEASKNPSDYAFDGYSLAFSDNLIELPVTLASISNAGSVTYSYEVNELTDILKITKTVDVTTEDVLGKTKTYLKESITFKRVETVDDDSNDNSGGGVDPDEDNDGDNSGSGTVTVLGNWKLDDFTYKGTQTVVNGGVESVQNIRAALVSDSYTIQFLEASNTVVVDGDYTIEMFQDFLSFGEISLGKLPNSFDDYKGNWGENNNKLTFDFELITHSNSDGSFEPEYIIKELTSNRMVLERGVNGSFVFDGISTTTSFIETLVFTR